MTATNVFHNKIKPQGKKNQKFNLNLYALRASLIQINF